jgi:hypothetical protein
MINLRQILGPTGYTELRRIADVVQVSPGATILPAGASSRWVFGLLDGTVVIEAPDGLTVLGAGAWFPAEAVRGELAALDASVRAVTQATVLSMGLREYRGARDTIHGFAGMVDTTTRLSVEV